DLIRIRIRIRIREEGDPVIPRTYGHPLAPPRDVETVSTKQVLGETVLDPVESKAAEQINRRYAIKRGQ
ncbi:unnamed protein product, partial [Musa banksii]